MKSLILFLTLFVIGSIANEWEKNEHYLVHEQLVQDINNDETSTFEAFHYDRFKGLSLDQLKKYTGSMIDEEHLKEVEKEALKNKNVVGGGDEDLPKSFNVWEKWPKCKEVFQTVQDQASCGACYGVGVASALTDRKCIKTNGTDTTQIASWDIVTCCEDCKADKSDGCQGGYQNRVYRWYKHTGVVSGDKYGGSNCMPYPVKPAEKPPKDYPVGMKFLRSIGILNLGTVSGSCKQSCQISYKKSYKDDKTKGGGYRTYVRDEIGVMREIQKNGPVTAAFT